MSFGHTDRDPIYLARHRDRTRIRTRESARRRASGSTVVSAPAPGARVRARARRAHGDARERDARANGANRRTRTRRDAASNASRRRANRRSASVGRRAIRDARVRFAFGTRWNRSRIAAMRATCACARTSSGARATSLSGKNNARTIGGGGRAGAAAMRTHAAFERTRVGRSTSAPIARARMGKQFGGGGLSVTRARAFRGHRDDVGGRDEGSSSCDETMYDDGYGAAVGRRKRSTVRARAILQSRETSMDGEDDVSNETNAMDSLDGVDMDALAAQVRSLYSEVEKLGDSGASAEELAWLESSLIDDDAANASADIPEREKLTMTTKKASSTKKTSARTKKSSMTTIRRVSQSEDESALDETENGVVTEGLAARSARARAVARGVRSRPKKASVSVMVQTQSKDRVRGVNLEPRKRSKQLTRTSKRLATDSMRSYLKDIGSVTLLNAGQEVELAKRIQDLMHLESIRENLVEETGPGAEVTDYQWASAAGLNVQALHQRLRDGKSAKNEMIQANLRLVVSIAKKYANSNMSFQDLIQEGCVGLIRGAEKFDFQRGYKFSTYAHWWIRQAVTRSISDQSRTIRLPVHLFEIISRISKMEQKFALHNGRNPTTEEIAAEMDMSAEKITQIKKAAQAPVSLAQTMGGDNKGRTVEDTLVDVTAEGPEKVSGKSLLKEDLENVLNTLNPRERDVLRLRYGLDDGRVKTLEEIGTVFSVTRERIRQIEAKALRKLKQPSRNSILQEYFADSDASSLPKPPPMNP